jgi:uncharacterized membrane protein YgcG
MSYCSKCAEYHYGECPKKKKEYGTSDLIEDAIILGGIASLFSSDDNSSSSNDDSSSSGSDFGGFGGGDFGGGGASSDW